MLLLLLILCYFDAIIPQQNDKNLFPSLGDQPITNITFPLELNIISNSKIVLVKCPGMSFKHCNNSNCLFSPAYNKKESYQFISSQDDKIRWIPVAVGKSKSSTDLTCGTLYDISTGERIEWYLNVKWEKSYTFKARHIYNLSKGTPDFPMSCPKEWTSIIGYVLPKNEDVKQYDPQSTPMAKGDVLYFFNKKDLISSNEYVVSCGISNVIHTFPDIVLKNTRVYKDKFAGNDIYVVNEKIIHKEYQIKLHLPLDSLYKNFFKNEAISTYELLGVKEDGVFNNIKKWRSVDNKVLVKKNYILRINYDCNDCDENRRTFSKIFFFGVPLQFKSVVKTPVIYTLGEGTQRPTCLRIFKNIGFLNKVSFNNILITINDFSSSISKGFVVQENKVTFIGPDPQGRLVCFYEIPGGNTVTTQLFKPFPKNNIYTDSYGMKHYPGSNEYHEWKRKQHESILDNSFDEVFRRKFNLSAVPSHDMGIYKNSSLPYDNNMEKHVEESEILGLYIVSWSERSRTYFLSNVSEIIILYTYFKGPNEKTAEKFWELIFNHRIGVICPVVFNKPYSFYDYYKKYWPEDDKLMRCGEIEIQFYGQRTIKDNGLAFVALDLFKHGLPPHSVTIVYCNSMKDYKLPEKHSDITSFYREVTATNVHQPVLFHSYRKPNMFIYVIIQFFIIMDEFLNKSNSTDSIKRYILNIMKRINVRSGGNSMTNVEFSYLIYNIIKCSINVKGVALREEFKIFKENYFNFVEKYMDNEKSSTDFNPFQRYINALSPSKLRKFCFYFNDFATLNDSSLADECTMFYKWKKFEKSYFNLKFDQLQYSGKDIEVARAQFKDKNLIIKDWDFPNIDSYNFSYNDSDSSIHEKWSDYLNASICRYAWSKSTKRELIICQAPLMKSRHRFIDILFRKKINLVIMLEHSSDEFYGVPKYLFPCMKDLSIVYGDYILSNISYTGRIKGVSISEINITQKEKNHKITLVTYNNWKKDKVISTSEFLELYNTIMKIKYEGPMIIMSALGLGRAGTLGLHFIADDCIKANEIFSLEECLLMLRKRRYLAVRTMEQYLLVLRALCEIYRDDVEKISFRRFDEIESMCEDVIQNYKEKMSNS
uniref:Transmembrane protein n=1 Tax=Parastrongyloides trichosuri TaxID=131310 RepID=A0A0N4Z910_PARTI